MKKALLHNLEPGRICEVVDEGSTFEVAEEFSWVDCPDDITTHDIYNVETGEFKKFNIYETAGFAENAYIVARGIAYKSAGDQLDMLYRELKANGVISTDGEWFNHIINVKNTIPKDNVEAVIEWNLQHHQQLQQQNSNN